MKGLTRHYPQRTPGGDYPVAVHSQGLQREAYNVTGMPGLSSNGSEEGYTGILLLASVFVPW